MSVNTIDTNLPVHSDTLRLFQKTDRKRQETNHNFQETSREIKAVTESNLLEDYNRLGNFVEEMALPGVTKQLIDCFAPTHIPFLIEANGQCQPAWLCFLPTDGYVEVAFRAGSLATGMKSKTIHSAAL
ncbi:MAG: hypothetical protein QX199_18795 [Methylococcaceae bacterium]